MAIRSSVSHEPILASWRCYEALVVDALVRKSRNHWMKVIGDDGYALGSLDCGSLFGGVVEFVSATILAGGALLADVISHNCWSLDRS